MRLSSEHYLRNRIAWEQRMQHKQRTSVLLVQLNIDAGTVDVLISINVFRSNVHTFYIPCFWNSIFYVGYMWKIRGDEKIQCNSWKYMQLVHLGVVGSIMIHEIYFVYHVPSSVLIYQLDRLLLSEARLVRENWREMIVKWQLSPIRLAMTLNIIGKLGFTKISLYILV